MPHQMPRKKSFKKSCKTQAPSFGNYVTVCQLENDLCTLMVVRSRLPFVRYVSASLAFLAQWTNKSPKKCNIERPHVQCTCHILLASKPTLKKNIFLWILFSRNFNVPLLLIQQYFFALIFSHFWYTMPSWQIFGLAKRLVFFAINEDFLKYYISY